MAVYAFCSVSGSPGVTTTAIGCCLSWPGPVVLFDADYQNAVVTGILSGQSTTDGSVLQVVSDVQSGKEPRDAIWDQTGPLPGDDVNGARRRFLPGVKSRPAVTSVSRMWGPLAAGLSAMASAEIDVVVDLGRLTGPGGIPPELMTVLSELCVFVRPTLRDIAAARWDVRQIAEQSGSSGKARLVLVDPAIRRIGFDDSEVAGVLQLPVRTRLPYDPAWAAVWSDDAPAPRRLASRSKGEPLPAGERRGRYRHAVADLASRLHGKARLRPESAFLGGSPV